MSEAGGGSTGTGGAADSVRWPESDRPLAWNGSAASLDTCVARVVLPGDGWGAWGCGAVSTTLGPNPKSEVHCVSTARLTPAQAQASSELHGNGTERVAKGWRN